MKNSIVLAMGLFIGSSSLAYATTCPSTNVVSDPETLQWTHHPVSATNSEEYYSGVLEMGEATFVINGETLTTRAYRQEGGQYGIPGPTVFMTPGNKYVLTFRNLLPYEAPSPEHNVFKDANISNLHTHGLHISGENPADDVTRVIEGGFAGDYVYEILPDHMGGTFWYHAHHHGSTYLQAAGGAFGLMIIDDQYDGIPAHVAAMVEKQVVVAYLDPNARGTSGDTLISGTLGAAWTVNGAINGNICTPPDTWQHWRVLLADRDGRLKTLSFGSQCEVALLARDGVWRTQVPKVLTTNEIKLTGASRADFAVRCSADASIQVNGNPVASIFVDGTADSAPHPFAADGSSAWVSKRPSYLRDLRGETPTAFETVSMGARTINGSKFDGNVPTFSVVGDGVQEWNIKGATNHPFHLHVFHFQVIGPCGNDFETGEYYDTLADGCTVRLDANPQTSSVFRGKAIMHCHILDHEDQGAMGWVNVLAGLEPPTFPVNSALPAPYQVRYAIGGGTPSNPPAAPGSLSATALSSTQISLNWNDNSTDESGFAIQRSTDSVNFATVVTVTTDVTSYTDSGLAAATAYSYRVSADNAAGSSTWSNTASATTLTDAGATSVQVGTIVLSTNNVGGGSKQGVATVVILDNLGNPIADAMVSGEFSGDINESIVSNTPTDASGTVMLSTTGTAKGGVTLQFCVTSVDHAFLQGLVAAPGAICGSL